MNPLRRVVFLIGAFTGPQLICPTRVVAVPFTHADVEMFNIHWTPAAGTFNWSMDWELSATALAFDSASGFVGESNLDFGGTLPLTLTANALGSYSSASANVVVDNSGQVLSLTSSMGLTVPPGDMFVSAFPAASAYREFTLTGGVGTVDVAFSFDYLGHLRGDAPGWGADFRALMSISDPTDLTVYQSGTGLMDKTFSGTVSKTVTLYYDTPYSITLNVDGDKQVPEAGPGLLLTGLVFLGLVACRRLHRNGVRTS